MKRKTMNLYWKYTENYDSKILIRIQFILEVYVYRQGW